MNTWKRHLDAMAPFIHEANIIRYRYVVTTFSGDYDPFEVTKYTLIDPRLGPLDVAKLTLADVPESMIQLVVLLRVRKITKEKQEQRLRVLYNMFHTWFQRKERNVTISGYNSYYAALQERISTLETNRDRRIKTKLDKHRKTVAPKTWTSAL